MDLATIKPTPGSRRKRKRVGRGVAANQGRTCGRGQKGQKARGRVPRGFEGGGTPLHRRIPMQRGKSKRSHNIGIFRKEYAVVNVGTLDKLEDGTVVDPDFLVDHRIVRQLKAGVKLLGTGELTKRLTVRAHAFSASARAKIEQAGGTAEVI